MHYFSDFKYDDGSRGVIFSKNAQSAQKSKELLG